MKKSKIIRYRRFFDPITSLLLFFTLFLFSLYAYLVKVNNNIVEYDMYHNAMSELKILDKGFDNFLLQKASFINYDDINGHIEQFEDKVEFLDMEASSAFFGREYKSLLAEVKQEYNLKRDNIELFKSRNASLLNSIHYLFDLNDVIAQKSTLDEKDIALVNHTLLVMIKFYVNNYIDTYYLNKNISILQSLLNEYRSIELKIFLTHIGRNLEHIKVLESVEKSVYKPDLHRTLVALDHFLDAYYKKSLLIKKSITTALFVIAIVILLVLLVMYRRSLKIKDELLGFKTAVENSDNSIVITDAQKHITYVNDVFEKETGYTQEEAIGQNPRILKSDQAPQSFYDNLHDTLEKGEKWEGEFVNKRKDGSLFYEKAAISPIFIHNELVSYLAIKLNITDYIKKQNEIKHLAYHDTLTSLPNRMNMEEYLTQRLNVARRSADKIALFFIDLDRFKTINDTLGHDVGDELLVQSALRMKQVLRDSDMLARIGGDEFTVIVEPVSDDYSTAQVAQKLLDLFSQPIKTKNHILNVTISIGVAIFPDDAKDYQSLLKHADVAMYKAKESGKNRYAYYEKSLSVDVHNRLNLEQALKNSLLNSEISVVYQPKYMLTSKQIVGFEALCRWSNSMLGAVPPDKFIPIAEEMEMILDIGAFVFRTACEHFLEFQKHATTCKFMAINVSPVQLYQKDILNTFLTICGEVGLETCHIVLEITEGHVMKNIELGIQILNEFKDAGFNISIDDFGTGHSSISYLKRFPIDELKIDKSFIDDVPDSINDASITKAIIALSKNLGYSNTAEGIENQEQEVFLRESGCELGQGFYFCKPQTHDNMIQILQERNSE
ncbi:MAG: EAL domain-containing protein [Campylobacterota bacterium]|nr:EAL domain-containing protein [Campylobacterota bacterium]